MRNVSTLAFGTVISQGVVILGSFVLARIYSAEAFGLLALFSSLTTIFAVFSTGRYEYSIVLPKNNKDAIAIIHLIFWIGLFISFIFFIGILILRNFSLGKYTALFHSNIIFLFPLYIFFIAILSALQYWNQRKKAYKIISLINLLQAIANTLFCIILGFLMIKNGLIFGVIFGVLVSIIYILYINKEILRKSESGSLKKMAKQYWSYPRYMLVSDLSMAFSQQFIPIIFSSIFTSAVVGYYAMANRLLRLPAIVLTTSISDVFRNEAVERVRDNGNCSSLYKKTVSRLIVIALPIFTIIYLVSPFAIKLVLGEKWLMSGYFAQVLCILLFFEFISQPLNSLFYIFEMQKIYMRIQFLNSVLGVLVIYASYKFFEDAKIVLFCFALNSALFNLICLFFTYKLSKKVFEKK